MFNLSSYLEKFKNLKNPKENKTIIRQIIQEVSGVEVIEEEITIQKATVYIQSGFLSKNRIFLTKESIIEKINTLLPDLLIRDII